MKIGDIQLKHLSIPLKKPFKTALRTVETAENTIVMITTEEGDIGFGEAPPTMVITGESNESIIAVIEHTMKEKLIGKEIDHSEEIFDAIQASSIKNYSAKAAVDMAVYDLLGKQYQTPLYKYLGGYRNQVETDLTISLNEPEEMQEDAVHAVERGFQFLKLKVGTDERKDIERVKKIREAVGNKVSIRLDANQGWTPKEAIRIIRRIEEMDLRVEFIEQPVHACDLEGLKMVTEHVMIPIMADESLFSPADALKILQHRAADLLNIKLMKCGGIYNALKIIAIAETYGVECMLGSMIESKVSLTAAAHLAAAKKNVTRVDLDAAILLAEDPVVGGFEQQLPLFMLTEAPGLGIQEIRGLKEIRK
ncbi:dipeptide epimerase [Clostridium aminobutyricum]|uniref:Dipeptide epimerase n=1 Tax=Clostridium aminobutyricum TaxID=33953 RepID=A0A939DB08_CLOAM|nr:dipeptide epimerase [Clostridium aminobutyricum]MBN7774435.1 dipeptide epimerase [Clostridium aminobutyricum]